MLSQIGVIYDEYRENLYNDKLSNIDFMFLIKCFASMRPDLNNF